jgi:membrane-bound lytic murein transglycosylase A
MIAQDTGGAIVGPARADIYFGAGDEAGSISGRLRHPGRFVMLLPRELDPGSIVGPVPLPRPKPPVAVAEKATGTKTVQAEPAIKSDAKTPEKSPAGSISRPSAESSAKSSGKTSAKTHRHTHKHKRRR